MDKHPYQRVIEDLVKYKPENWERAVSYINNYHPKKCNRGSTSLAELFNWQASPQGLVFWGDMYMEMEMLEKV